MPEDVADAVLDKVKHFAIGFGRAGDTPAAKGTGVLCHVNVAIDLSGLPQIPAPVTDQSCAAASSANTLIGVGCPHAPPSCANLHSARRSRRHRLPFPAGSFLGGFRTPATVQAASLPSAGIRNPQQFRKFVAPSIARQTGVPFAH
jgi:hypothetical protein